MKTKKRLRNKADKLWYEKYLKPSCEVCGKPASQLHHYFYKSTYGHLRYNKDNGISLCQACHFTLHHQDPKKIEALIIKARGKRWLTKLTKQATNRPATSYQTISYYEQQIKNLS